TVAVKNLKTGRMLKDEIKETTGDLEWAEDNKTLFFVKQNPETLRAEKIFRRELGAKKSELVYFEEDTTFGVDLSKTLTDKFLLITSYSKESTEVRFLDAKTPKGEWRVLQKREPHHEYSIDDGGDGFYIHTNWEAPNFRIMKVGYEKTGKENWQTLIKH